MTDEEQTESSPVESPEVAEQEPEEVETAQAESVEESATSSEETSEPAEGESAVAPEAAKSSAKRSNAETRIRKLTGRLKELERALAEREQVQAKGTPDLVEPSRPKLSDFDDLEKYEKAVETYAVDLRTYAERKAVAEREQKAKAESEEQAKTKARQTWEQRVADTVKRVPDFDADAAMREVNPSQVMSGFLVHSKIGPDVLAYLQDNPDDADRIRGIADPFEAHEELLQIQATISERIHGKQKSAPKVPNYVKGAGASPAKERSAADVLYR